LNHLLTHRRNRRAAVTVLVATLLPVLLGMAGLATAYGDALLIKMKAQRIADAAAYAGAVAYGALSTTTAITNAANRVATINGIPTGDISAVLVTSPRGDGYSAVQATVTIGVNVGLTRPISNTSSLSVTSSAYVEIKVNSNGIPCIIALGSTGSGVTLSGSGKITANACAVSSNSSTAPAITAPSSSATVTTPVVSTPVALTTNQKKYIVPPTGTTAVTYIVKSITDPLASKTAVTTATGHLSSVGSLGNPTMTTPPSGSNVSFASASQTGTLPSGCVPSSSGSTWTISCTGAGPFNFTSVSVSGSATVVFNNPTSATYNFSGSISNSGTALTFNGAGTYNIGGGLSTSGSSTTKFNGTGTYNIGKYTSSCSGDNFSICHSGATLTFAGPSTFVLTNGLYDGGGSTMTMGSGSTLNSYKLGASTNGWTINMGGGASLTMNDATGTGGLFQASGNITNGGGSCMALPVASAHDIKGYVTVAGGTTLGAGVYTIYGYMAAGVINGGTVTCGGTTIGLTANAVTFVLGGNSTVTCSNIATAFCIAGGYSNVILTAPTTGSTANLAVVGPTTSTNTAGASLSAGASGANISGAFYFPYGPFVMGGAASIGGGCLELIAKQVTVSQGSAAGSTCTGLGGSSLLHPYLALVQ
jgi:Flp pilus assembly protein TadG